MVGILVDNNDSNIIMYVFVRLKIVERRGVEKEEDGEVPD